MDAQALSYSSASAAKFLNCFTNCAHARLSQVRKSHQPDYLPCSQLDSDHMRPAFPIYIPEFPVPSLTAILHIPGRGAEAPTP